MSKNNKIYALVESEVSYSEILETSTASSQDSEKAYFKAILQTADDVNSHNRIYPRELLQKGINELRPKIESRTLLGEMDHPLPQSPSREVNMMRESVVLYKDASHLFTNVYMEGNKVIGDVETLSNTHGKNLANLVLKDKLPIGFSLRAFGSLSRQGNNLIVQEPFVIVTWDAVAHPSHKTARLYEIREDDVKEMIYSSALMEGVSTSVIDTLIEHFAESNLINDEYLLYLIRKHVSKLKNI